MSIIRDLLIETATKIFDKHCTKEILMEAEKGMWSDSLWKILQNSGMHLIGISEGKGGGGGDVEDVLSYLKIVGKYAVPLPLAENFLANWMITNSGLDVLEEPATIAADIFFFKRTDNGWIVNGKGTHIPWASKVKHLVVIGQTENHENVIGILDLQKCRIESRENLAKEPRDDVLADNVFVPVKSVSQRLFTEDDLEKMRMATKIMLMAGALEKILELTISYAKERTQFGRPIGKFQVIKQQLAIMAGEAVVAHTAHGATIHAVQHAQATNKIKMAKIQLNQAATKVTNIAHQILGAMGYTNEHILHYYTKRLWSWREECGRERNLSAEIGSEILSEKDVWSYVTK
jgi:acyl-CoA dehydrogenase